MAGAVLEPVVARYRGEVRRLYFRGDAAFADSKIYEFLEAEGIGYSIRLQANRVLRDRIGYLFKRPVARPPHFSSITFTPSCGRWRCPRRRSRGH
jgi:hypothetical protein